LKGFVLLDAPVKASFDFSVIWIKRAIPDKYIFKNINQVRELTANSMDDYNYIRPHKAVGNLPLLNTLKTLTRGLRVLF